MRVSFSISSLAVSIVGLLCVRQAHGWVRDREMFTIEDSKDDVFVLYQAYKSGQIDLDDDEQNDDVYVSLLTQAVLQQSLRFKPIFDWCMQWDRYALDPPHFKQWGDHLWPRYYLPGAAEDIPYEQFVLDDTGEPLIHEQTDREFFHSDAYEGHVDAPTDRIVRSYVLRPPITTDILPLRTYLNHDKVPIYWPSDMPLIRANCWTWVIMTIAHVVLSARERWDLTQQSKQLYHQVLQAGRHTEETHPEAIMDLWKEAIGLDRDHAVVDADRPHDVPAGVVLHRWTRQQVSDGLNLRRPQRHVFPGHTLLVMDPSICGVGVDKMCTDDLYQRTESSLLHKHDNNVIDPVGGHIIDQEGLRKFIWTYQRVKKPMKPKMLELYGKPNEQ